MILRIPAARMNHLEVRALEKERDRDSSQWMKVTTARERLPTTRAKVRN
jgi:hypothetical protein